MGDESSIPFSTDGLGPMEQVSRTQKKKKAEALQRLGERLVALTDAQMDALDLIPELIEALKMARQMNKHGARRRQMQYIGRLMREIDPDGLEKALGSIQSQADHDKRRFKLIEQWCDELVAGSPTRASWLVKQYPDMDGDQLNQLVKQAVAEKHTSKARKTGRMLFRFLSRSAQI